MEHADKTWQTSVVMQTGYWVQSPINDSCPDNNQLLSVDRCWGMPNLEREIECDVHGIEHSCVLPNHTVSNWERMRPCSEVEWVLRPRFPHGSTKPCLSYSSLYAYIHPPCIDWWDGSSCPLVLPIVHCRVSIQGFPFQLPLASHIIISALRVKEMDSYKVHLAEEWEAKFQQLPLGRKPRPEA